jgi:hypothetical protein
MIGKLTAVWRVFRKGEEVANPAAWKLGQITATAIIAFLAAAAQAAAAFGYEVPVNEDQLTAIAGGVLAVGNVLLTLITSKRVGLPAVGEAALRGDEP